MIHLVLIALLTVTGCYSAGNAGVKNSALVAQVKIRQTTKKNVQSLFGAPNSDTALAAIDSGLAEQSRQRDVLTGQLPVALRKRYDMLIERRNGLAAVEARGGACLGCHMHLPPQLFNRLFVAQEVQNCPHCNRLLFLGEA